MKIFTVLKKLVCQTKGIIYNSNLSRSTMTKSRKSLGTAYASNRGLTNIRPSHYFISIPRSSVSYKATEPIHNDSIKTQNRGDYASNSNQLTKLGEFNDYQDKLKTWKSNQAPSLPSNRRLESQDMTKTLRNYQNLRRSIADQSRKTQYSNNRWREEAGKVVNSMTGQEHSASNGLRSKAFLKYQKKHQEILQRSACKVEN